MKLEVGKEYELNNGEVRVCLYMKGDDPKAIDARGFGPFVTDYCGLYHQDGKFADGCTPSLDVKRCVSDGDAPEETLAEQAARLGICITLTNGQGSIVYDGRPNPAQSAE